MSRFLRALRTSDWPTVYEQLYRMGDTRVGRLIGTDMFNNRYYESTEYPNPLGRWVIHGNKKEDVSQIPAEWHMWLHQMNDDAPSRVNILHQSFETPHVETLTGTSGAYMPYSTTKPKISEWNGKPANRA